MNVDSKGFFHIIVSFNIFKHFLYFTAIHCEWGEWVEGECSHECGVGTQTNTRDKIVEELNGGTCTGGPTEIVECLVKECPGT